MKRWGAALAAAGITLALAISLWTERTGSSAVHLADLLGSSALALVTVAIGWALASRLATDTDRRGLIALVFGIWGLAFGTFHVLAATHLLPALESKWLAAACWTGLCILIVLLVARTTAPIPFVARALSIAAVVLLATQVSRPVTAALRNGDVDTARPRSPANTTPSVYVIVLDKYSSGEWLRHSYGVDQSAFEKELAELGFVVPHGARANYAHTQISLASFLNWQYVDDIDTGSQPAGWDTMRELIANARAWEAFRERGYRVVAFPTTFSATRSFRSVDLELRPPNLRPSQLPMTWWSNSPVQALAALACGALPCPSRGSARGTTPYPIEPLDVLEWKLDALASLPDSAGPVFAFVHLLVPHEPYLFNTDCSGREPWWPLGDQGEHFDAVGEAYGHQVKCLAPLLLKTVRNLLERSQVRPVIVLQSDHGHGRIAVDPLRGFTLSSDELSPDQLGDRLGVFAAYTFPGAHTVVRDDISPVNVLPLVMRSLFGEGPDEQPDRSYWSSYQAAFSFTELPAELTRPAGGPMPVAAELSAVRDIGAAIR